MSTISSSTEVIVIAYHGDDNQQHFTSGVLLNEIFAIMPLPKSHYTVVHVPSERMMAHFFSETEARGFCEDLDPDDWRFERWRGTDEEKERLKTAWTAAAKHWNAYES